MIGEKFPNKLVDKAGQGLVKNNSSKYYDRAKGENIFALFNFLNYEIFNDYRKLQRKT